MIGVLEMLFVSLYVVYPIDLMLKKSAVISFVSANVVSVPQSLIAIVKNVRTR